MNNNNMQEVINIIDSDHVGVLSTMQGNKPHARYMMFFHDESQLYTATNKKTHKVEEIQNNPNVHVLLGFDQKGDKYIELQGKANVVNDQQLKEKYWNDQLAPWLDGPNDPDYCLLQINPEHIELINGNNETTIM
ncbi:pyridoxamine 5'-phosphate oxidase family protein [Anaerobacillus isosaccharinicus]|uniref:General stress protein n=1 Tax=Anaerobacillus isosaccharinicus TaxID=1532552 RepID=A0A1S2L8V3_9BACI|nr:pyridoxamine 5'-phosphate oxidase family protein [Anaerobacillus isosaccharinicus]MBA5588646.1 pyridoxamine 5'-phosphate oxidase family protein [Anaerobacillus isosaccharinicus]QOY37947.1 pyridoxamine 5'-phosphate oxidase family protein [Anaerobacillus isosaccharinicus]